MFSLLARLHGLLFKLVLWLLALPLKSLWSLLGALLALLGEEFRRWLGIIVIGLMIAGVSWATLKVAAQQRLVLLLVLLMGMLWLYGVFRAAHLTAENRLWRVRQRQMFRQLSGQVGQLPQQLDTLRGEVGRRARGTPLEGMWQSNRDDRDREQAAAEAAAAQAKADRQARQERDRELVRLGAEHNPFERQGG